LGMMAVLLVSLPNGPARGRDGDAPTWSPKAAAAYLDDRADWWLGWSGSARGQGTACLSCHTALPFALARPGLIGSVSGSEIKLLDGVKKRVANWDKIVGEPTAADVDPFVPYYGKERKPSALGTESVLNALVLVTADRRQGTGPLAASTQTALAHLWEQQDPSGAWRWLDFGMNPWEKDGAYYGAALAAVAVGTAGPSHYDQADVRPKVAALVNYLRTRFSRQPLHHRIVGLWASAMLPGVLSEAETTKLIEELFAVQRADGGWPLTSLGRTPAGRGEWKARAMYSDGTVSDGYATGLIVLALTRAGLPAEHPNLRRAMDWLAAQQADGSWPATYPNSWRDPTGNIGKFMRDAATAYAVLALTDAGRTAPQKGPISK
jgi:squalene-hopene/tetraprenyl-beta-curcumene cyclase